MGVNGLSLHNLPAAHEWSIRLVTQVSMSSVWARIIQEHYLHARAYWSLKGLPINLSTSDCRPVCSRTSPPSKTCRRTRRLDDLYTHTHIPVHSLPVPSACPLIPAPLHPPAGLSTYMPLRQQAPILSEANKATPVLMCHGKMDNVVNFRFGQATAETLKGLGANITFKTYDSMAHSVSRCSTRMARAHSSAP